MVARPITLALLVSLLACAGPRPTVGDVAVSPSPIPGHVRVTGALVNRGGHGSVAIHVALRGATTVRADYTSDVETDEQIHLVLDVAAPAGDYQATVTPEYPN